MSLLAAVHPVVVRVPEAANGVSFESVLVFVAGVLAAAAAVAAALLTTRGAARRLADSLDAERERFDKQLAAERDRMDRQLAHERYLARRDEASVVIERIARLVSRNEHRASRISQKILEDDDPAKEELQALRKHLRELYEESNVVAVRFGTDSTVVNATLQVIKALNSAIPWVHEMPLSEEKKKEIRRSLKEAGKALQHFLGEAKKAMDDYT